MDSETKRRIEEIRESREEILEAFIAKYGFEPDEAVQVYTHGPLGSRWHVRKMTAEDLNNRIPESVVRELIRLRHRSAAWKAAAKKYRSQARMYKVWNEFVGKSACAWEDLCKEYALKSLETKISERNYDWTWPWRYLWQDVRRWFRGRR